MTAGSYRTRSGRPAARAPHSPADLARRIRASRLALEDCPRRDVLEVVRSSSGGEVLTVVLRCGHRVDVTGPKAPITARCRPCGLAALPATPTGGSR